MSDRKLSEFTVGGVTVLAAVLVSLLMAANVQADLVSVGTKPSGLDGTAKIFEFTFQRGADVLTGDYWVGMTATPNTNVSNGEAVFDYGSVGSTLVQNGTGQYGTNYTWTLKLPSVFSYTDADGTLQNVTANFLGLGLTQDAAGVGYGSAISSVLVNGQLPTPFGSFPGFTTEGYIVDGNVVTDFPPPYGFPVYTLSDTLNVLGVNNEFELTIDFAVPPGYTDFFANEVSHFLTIAVYGNYVPAAKPQEPETGGGATPEPATLALFGIGFAGLVAARRRKR